MKNTETVGLKARAEQIRAGIIDAEGALADAKRRQATTIAEGGAQDPKLAAEITAGAVAIDASREALQLVEAKLAAAVTTEDAARVEAVRRRTVEAERKVEEAVRGIRPAVAALRPLLDAARAAVERLRELRAQAGRVTDRVDVGERALLGALVAEGLIDSRVLNASYAALVAGDPVEADRRERADAARAETERAADEAYWSRPDVITRQLEKLDREDRELKRFHGSAPAWAAKQQADIDARRAALVAKLEAVRAA